MKFDWNPTKHAANLAAADRAFGFDYAARIFAGDTIETDDRRAKYGERRVQAVGEVEGNVLFVVYVDRGDTRWIISARKASREERQAWHER